MFDFNDASSSVMRGQISAKREDRINNCSTDAIHH